MNNAERIYALYVQANPVPNPDLLAATRDETVLHPIEGSEDMITQEPIEERPFVRATRRNVLVAVGAFAAILVVGLATVLLVDGGNSGPVAAGDARPEVVFDGTTCTYDGPTQIEVGTVEFMVLNQSDTDFTLAGWLLAGEALETELLRTPVGSDMAITAGDPMPAGLPSFGWPTDAGSSRTETWLAAPGTHLVDCVVTGDHVWRPARIEVVGP